MDMPLQPAQSRSWASLVLPRVMPDNECVGCIFVLEPSTKRQPLWKIPGGKRNYGKGDRTPEDTARHELRDETGLPPDNLRHIASWSAGDHDKHLFVTDIRAGVEEVLFRLRIGNDGERPDFFNPHRLGELIARGLILPEHRDLLLKHELVRIKAP